MKTVNHDRNPGVSLLRLALGFKKGLKEGERLPQLSHTWKGMPLTEGAGYRSICGLTASSGLMPLCWPFVAAVPLQKAALADPAFTIPAFGMVHLAQDMEWLGELDLLRPVDCAVTLGTTHPARRGVEFDMVTLMSQDGRGVWQSHSRIWSAKGPGGGEKRERVLPLELTPPAQSRGVNLPESLGRRYSAIAGDRNPIHQHAWLARPFGFNRAITHGMWNLARALGEIEESAGKPVRKASAKFVAPVFMPGAIELQSGKVASEGWGANLLQDSKLCMVVQAILSNA